MEENTMAKITAEALEAVAGDAAIDSAIDKLAMQGDKTPAKKSMAMELFEEAEADSAEAASTNIDPETGKPRKNPSVWTFDTMRKRGPQPADLYGDGAFVFTFRPQLHTQYCQDRYKIADDYFERKVGEFTDAQTAYAEILFEVMHGCEWPVRETLDDSVTGLPLYEEDGVTPKSAPMPITLENIKRMTYEMISDFLVAMRDAQSGKVSTKP